MGDISDIWYCRKSHAYAYTHTHTHTHTHAQAVEVSLMENILPAGKLKVSSNDAMSNSLTDGSTETFWESRDEPRGRPRQLTVTFEEEQRVFGAVVHIDNQKDSGVGKCTVVYCSVL